MPWLAFGVPSVDAKDERAGSATRSDDPGRRETNVSASHTIAIKRAYEPATRDDGVRILVDRLWPRGLRKDVAKFDQWRKDVAPSTELRNFYGHRPELWPEFQRRYRGELRHREAAAAVRELIALTHDRNVTLLTASSDLDESGAAALAAHMRAIVARAARSDG
jgi:uncharacterized protein YeaO (DUF488 family)